jgi:hypothetical protein
MDGAIRSVASDLDAASQHSPPARIDPDELNRLLDFLEDVIRVVREAFGQVLGFLRQCEALQPDALTPAAASSLLAQVDALKSRTWWNAQGVCGALKEIGEIYQATGGPDPLLRAAAERLPDAPAWKAAFDLVLYREGAIVLAVDHDLVQLTDIFGAVARGERAPRDAAGEVRDIAGERARETEQALGDLRDAVARLQARSGRAGRHFIFDRWAAGPGRHAPGAGAPGERTRALGAFHRALTDAYDRRDLEALAEFELGTRLDHITGAGAVPKVTLDLIQWADEQGRLGDLATAAAKARPGRPDLQQVVSQLLAVL